MDHFQGMTAEIISNRQVLDLYDDPDSAEVKGSHTRHHYVKAVAGSTFQMKVDRTPQFNFYEMKPEHPVSISVKIDGNHDSALGTKRTKKDLQGQFFRGETGGFMFTGPKHICEEDG